MSYWHNNPFDDKDPAVPESIQIAILRTTQFLVFGLAFLLLALVSY